MSVRGPKQGIPRAYLPQIPVDPEEIEDLSILALVDEKPLDHVVHNAVRDYLRTRRGTITKNRDKYRRARFEGRVQRG